MNATVFWGLASALTWGVGDFCGGLATRRVVVWSVVFYSQAVGMGLALLLAIGFGEALPSLPDLAWGAAAGLAGMIGLIALYQAMALGQMALVAPLSGAIALAIPVSIAIVTEGWPASPTLLGFTLAALSVMLISYTPHQRAVAGSLWIALVAGCGFGSFFVLIAQAEDTAVFWPLVAARCAAVVALSILMATQRRFTLPTARQAFLPIILAGVFDVGGNACFVLAEGAGRLDIASTLSSLYPVSTVLLALLLLRERISLLQGVGVLSALVAIPLMAQ